MRQIPDHVKYVMHQIADEHGYPLLVGGAVRDSMLNTQSKDFDIEVYNLSLSDLHTALAKLPALHRIEEVGKSFGVFKVYLDGHEAPLDISLPRRDNKAGVGHKGFTIEADPMMQPIEAAARRDFTWNAMAMDVSGNLFDFYHGLRDLRAGVIRHTSPAFAEDPLRVLRAFQFAARFGFTIAPETIKLCQDLLPEADTLPVERVWEEWKKWAVKGTAPKNGLEALRDTRWIKGYPAIETLIGCPQEPSHHPEGDVFNHTCYAVDQAVGIAERDQLSEDDRLVLVFAALCHDFGKPTTTETHEDGRITSYGHDEAGVEPANSFLMSIGAPVWLVESVEPLVREHMAHINACTPRTVRRLAQRLAPSNIKEWARLVLVDTCARPPLIGRNAGQPFVEIAKTLDVLSNKPEMIVHGRDVIAAGLGVPGPALGKMLKAAFEAQLDGAFQTLDEGLEWIKQNQS